MPQAAIYVRVSRDEQAKNYSLPTQKAGCEQYAAQHHLTVIATCVDDETGATTERPG
jgi:DNA invertase Pin-like site-specific DNA recombinase